MLKDWSKWPKFQLESDSKETQFSPPANHVGLHFWKSCIFTLTPAKAFKRAQTFLEVEKIEKKLAPS